LDIATDGCSIANPLNQTENQIGIAYVTRHTVRSFSSSGCSYFQLVAAAQRKNFMAAVIMIRNDSAFNNEWEGGYFFEGTTSIIFTEIQAYEAILNRVGGSAQIQRMSAPFLAAPDNGESFFTVHRINSSATTNSDKLWSKCGAKSTVITKFRKLQLFMQYNFYLPYDST
jgi:hypothetical protein